MWHKRWSKLQKHLYDRRAPELEKHFQIHCEVYRMKSNYGSTDLPRYWISLDGKILWDYPKQFAESGQWIHTADSKNTKIVYPYETYKVSDIMQMYLESAISNVDEIKDDFGLVQILKAADRRIGKRTMNKMLDMDSSDAVKDILKMRLDI